MDNNEKNYHNTPKRSPAAIAKYASANTPGRWNNGSLPAGRAKG